MGRHAISRGLRFEVFRRDCFTCQYCGKRAPDVVLQCDHITPVADGGPTSLLNLITACTDCNAGKGRHVLPANLLLAKQHARLAELQERDAQFEMMMEWREKLHQLEIKIVDQVAERWRFLLEGQAEVTPRGRDLLRRLIGRYGEDIVLQSLDEATVSCLERDDSHAFTRDSMEKTFEAIHGICRVLHRSRKRPYLRRLYAIRRLLRRRLTDLNEWHCLRCMEEAVLAGGAELDRIEEVARNTRSWAQFRSIMESWAVAGADGDQPVRPSRTEDRSWSGVQASPEPADSWTA